MKIEAQIYDDADYALRIEKIVRDIAKAYCEYIRTGTSTPKFALKPQQRITIEDLLHIFGDRMELVNNFLTFTIEKLGQTHGNELPRLAVDNMNNSINIYHRLLENSLYIHQAKKKSYRGDSQESHAAKKFRERIFQFIEKHHGHVDYGYILLLFKNYNFAEGVKKCCELLGLRRELLNYYI